MGTNVRLVDWRARKHVSMALGACISLLSLAIVLLTPVALGLFSSTNREEWERRSFIGQTYGAASAVLSVLALGGIAFSLILQNREAKAAREQGLRALHLELVKLALDDPLYLSCFGPFGDSADIDDRRKYLYTNLLVSHWQLTWEVGAIKEDNVRVLARDLFAGESGRRFWSSAGPIRLDTSDNRNARKFHVIMNQVYSEALTQPISDINDG